MSAHPQLLGPTRAGYRCSPRSRWSGRCLSPGRTSGCGAGWDETRQATSWVNAIEAAGVGEPSTGKDPVMATRRSGAGRTAAPRPSPGGRWSSRSPPDCSSSPWPCGRPRLARGPRRSPVERWVIARRSADWTAFFRGATHLGDPGPASSAVSCSAAVAAFRSGRVALVLLVITLVRPARLDRPEDVVGRPRPQLSQLVTAGRRRVSERAHPGRLRVLGRAAGGARVVGGRRRSRCVRPRPSRRSPSCSWRAVACTSGCTGSPTSSAARCSDCCSWCRCTEPSPHQSLRWTR